MSGEHEFARITAPSKEGDPPEASAREANSAGSYVLASPELLLYAPEPAVAYPEEGQTAAAARPRLPRPRLIPNIGNTALFFALAVFVMVLGQGLTTWGAKRLHLFGSLGWEALATDARLSIPSQAVEYLAIFAVAVAIFSFLWDRPFLSAVRWNAPAVHGRVRGLALAGLLLGFGVGLGGDFLPMPKDAPIVQDMMNTSAGAWLMFLFSFTGAPLMEELAFRGFMLPSLLNAFRWTSDRGWLPAPAARWIGLPASVIATSFCFALMHAPQVSHSWGPVLLIGVVSLVLCIVRLRLDSVLAGAVVHAAYNFTLFAGILITTDGFRHLDKLKG